MERPESGVTQLGYHSDVAHLKRKRGDLEKDEGEEVRAMKGEKGSGGVGHTAPTTTAAMRDTALPSGGATAFETLVLDESRYKERRHAALPDEVTQLLRTRSMAGTGGTGANMFRFIDEAVRRKQVELDRTNHLYKAIARKSFQISVTLLLPADTEEHASQKVAACDIYRTVVLPAAIQLSKLHKTLQMILGWSDKQKYMFTTSDGVPIAKHSKDEVPCLSDSRIRLAYIVKDSGDEFYYVYGDWVHRLLVETVGAPRRNIPSTRVIAGAGDCPPEDMSPRTYAAAVAAGKFDKPTFSVDMINVQLMAGQTFYMRIPAGASKEHEEYVCLRAMRTPVNILSAPTAEESQTPSSVSSFSSSDSSSSGTSIEAEEPVSSFSAHQHAAARSKPSTQQQPSSAPSSISHHSQPSPTSGPLRPQSPFTPIRPSSMPDLRGGERLGLHPQELYQRQLASPSVFAAFPPTGSTSTCPIPSSGSFGGFPMPARGQSPVPAPSSMHGPPFSSYPHGGGLDSERWPVSSSAHGGRGSEYYSYSSETTSTSISSGSSYHHPGSQHQPRYEYWVQDQHHQAYGIPAGSSSSYHSLPFPSHSLSSISLLPLLGSGPGAPSSSAPPEYAPPSWRGMDPYGSQRPPTDIYDPPAPSSLLLDQPPSAERLPPLQSPFTSTTSPSTSPTSQQPQFMVSGSRMLDYAPSDCSSATQTPFIPTAARGSTPAPSLATDPASSSLASLSLPPPPD